jgi:hypothetical protein
MHDVPNELLLTILSYLSPHEVINTIMLVDSHWNELSHSNELWQYYVYFRYGFNYHPCFKVDPSNCIVSYYEWYKNLYEQEFAPLVVRNRFIDVRTCDTIELVTGRSETTWVDLPTGHKESGLNGYQLHSPFLQYLKYKQQRNAMYYSIELFILVDSISKKLLKKTRGLRFKDKVIAYRTLENPDEDAWSVSMSSVQVNMNPLHVYDYDCYPHDLIISTCGDGVMVIERETGEIRWINQTVPCDSFLVNTCYGYEWSMMSTDLASDKMTDLEGYGVILCIDERLDVITALNILNGEQMWQMQISRFGSVHGIDIICNHFILRLSDFSSLIITKFGEVAFIFPDSYIIGFQIYPETNHLFILKPSKAQLLLLRKKECDDQYSPIYDYTILWELDIPFDYMYTAEIVRLPLTQYELLYRKRTFGDRLPMEDVVLQVSLPSQINLSRIDLSHGSILWNIDRRIPKTIIDLQLDHVLYVEVRGNKLVVAFQSYSVPRIIVIDVTTGALTL